MSAAARALHGVVRFYQRLFGWRPTPCRYLPTCSNYALDALEGHGALKGSWLTARRLGRCHPWGGHGWDPVPEPANRRRSGSELEPIGPVGETPELLEHRCST
jgi:putative membrane protein insertion efficiency factor